MRPSVQPRPEDCLSVVAGDITEWSVDSDTQRLAEYY